MGAAVGNWEAMETGVGNSETVEAAEAEAEAAGWRTGTEVAD